MDAMFDDSDFDDTLETQLTLGTGSLLGIFFGVVMVCGVFFGFGYSMGRRNTMLAVAVTQPARIAPVAQPALPIMPQQPAFTSAGPGQDNGTSTVPNNVSNPSTAPEAAPAMPLLDTAKTVTPARPGMNSSASTSANSSASSSATPMGASTNLAAARTDHSAQRSTDQTLLASAAVAAPPVQTVHALLEQKHIAKPSAIQPTVEQPDTRIPLGPQFTAQNQANPYLVWTPPFDVRYKHGVARRVLPPTSRSTPPTLTLARATPTRMAPSGPPLVVQIAALSKQDDAEVLASALREHGFAPSIKNGAEDTLYHVQVGPFSRDIAFATRQRLIAKGYNAILK
jgi:DedD protein